jgi:hypothetical protein
MVTVASGSELNDKVKNIIGTKNYNIHKNLLNSFFKDESKYLINNKINYLKVFSKLKHNGLMDLRLEKPQDIEITFKLKHSTFKAYKILKHTMQALGYRHIITKSMTVDDSNQLQWIISLKTEYMIDSYMLILELLKNNCKVTNIDKTTNLMWVYTLDFENARIAQAKKIPSYERVIFNKPLNPIMIKSNNVKKIEIISRVFNRWYPHIIFYDKDLNVLSSITRLRVVKRLNENIPNDTVYIIIKDMYNLVNIKRGLTIIVR